MIQQIEIDQSRRSQNKFDEPISILVVNSNNSDEQSTISLDGRFLQSQLLISCLLKMKNTQADKCEFLLQCRQFYKDNAKQLKHIDDFAKNYKAEHCLWWYTLDSFLYRILNKALRAQNTHLLFLMRFFIRDIEQELHQRRHSAPIRLYRGQLMSTDEINLLKNSINNLISISAFFSTSRNLRVAEIFADPSKIDQTLERVIFEIDADPCQSGVKPFADLSGVSQFSQESEILMMLGSVFRLEQMYCDENQIWHINLTLYTDRDLQDVLRHMSNQYDPMNFDSERSN